MTHHRFPTLVSSPLWDPPRIRRTASTHRRANRRVTLKPKPHRVALETARFFVEGAAAARGFVDDRGVHWVAFYDVVELFDVTDDGRVISLGYRP